MGKIVNQRPVPTGAAQKVNCTDWTKKWILKKPSPNPWILYKKEKAFIYLLLAELGSIRHLDRLTIFLGRPNRMKGAVSLMMLLYSPSLSSLCTDFLRCSAVTTRQRPVLTQKRGMKNNCSLSKKWVSSLQPHTTQDKPLLTIVTLKRNGSHIPGSEKMCGTHSVALMKASMISSTPLTSGTRPIKMETRRSP